MDENIRELIIRGSFLQVSGVVPSDCVVHYEFVIFDELILAALVDTKIVRQDVTKRSNFTMTSFSPIHVIISIALLRIYG